MKKLLVGAAVAGGAAFALRRLARHGRNVRDHCRDMMRNHCLDMIAGRQESKPAESRGCGSCR